MKTVNFILLAGLLVCGCSKQPTVAQAVPAQTSEATNLTFVDDKLAAKAEVVLRARLLSMDTNGANAQFRVQVLQIIKSEPGIKVMNELLVDSSGSKDGLPIGGKFTIYLNRHDQTNTALWMLVGASHNNQ